MDKSNKGPDPTELIGGTLNIFGLKFDLSELLASPESVQGHLEQLREKLKEAGGKEVLSDAEWRAGGASITGSIRTRGLAGDREFHLGTLGKPRGGAMASRRVEETQEVAEPPVDVFDEPDEVTIIADVPGVSLEDLEVRAHGNVLSINTRAKARRHYRKEVRVDADLDPTSLRSTCRNGVLEARVRKRGGS